MSRHTINYPDEKLQEDFLASEIKELERALIHCNSLESIYSKAQNLSDLFVGGLKGRRKVLEDKLADLKTKRSIESDGVLFSDQDQEKSPAVLFLQFIQSGKMNSTFWNNVGDSTKITLSEIIGIAFSRSNHAYFGTFSDSEKIAAARDVKSVFEKLKIDPITMHALPSHDFEKLVRNKIIFHYREKAASEMRPQ